MSLLYNMLSRFVIAFLPRSKCLLISWLQSLFAVMEPKKINCFTIKKNQKTKRSLLGRKAMTNLDSALKSRDITLPLKAYLVKAMVFPVVMYEWGLP